MTALPCWPCENVAIESGVQGKPCNRQRENSQTEVTNCVEQYKCLNFEMIHLMITCVLILLE